MPDVIAHVRLDRFPRRDIFAQPFEPVVKGLDRLAVSICFEQARPERGLLPLRFLENRHGGHVEWPSGSFQQQERQVQRAYPGHRTASFTGVTANRASSSSTK